MADSEVSEDGQVLGLSDQALLNPQRAMTLFRLNLNQIYRGEATHCKKGKSITSTYVLIYAIEEYDQLYLNQYTIENSYNAKI